MHSSTRRNGSNDAHENARAFSEVVGFFVRCRHSQPLVSSLGKFDITHEAVYRQRTADISHFVCDVELAIRQALRNRPRLVERFDEWFGDDDELALPPMGLESSRTYNELTQRIGRELRRRQIFPLRGYFGYRPRYRSKEMEEVAA